MDRAVPQQLCNELVLARCVLHVEQLPLLVLKQPQPRHGFLVAVHRTPIVSIVP